VADEVAAEAVTALAKTRLREHTMRKTVTALQDEPQTTRQQGKGALRKDILASNDVSKSETNDEINSLVDMLEKTRMEAQCAA
jgi:hypothetical protein